MTAHRPSCALAGLTYFETAGMTCNCPSGGRSRVPEVFPGNGVQTRSGSVPVFPTHVPGNGEHSVSPHSGLFYDVAGMLDGGLPDPPSPVVGTRTDGRSLFYAGQVNLVFGDPESGKTFLCLAASAEALNHGRKVLVVDLDHNGPAATIDRLLMLGAQEAALADTSRFLYVEPEDAPHLMAVVAAGIAWRPAVALIDSVGELLPVFGFSSNSPDDFTIVNSRVLKPLAMAGAAVLGIDHLAKGTESRTSGPTGTAAKKRAVGGASVRVTIKDAFTPGRGGAAAITIHKDRHGGLRQYCPPPDGGEAYAGTFVLKAESEGTTSWRITAPELGDRAPAGVAEADIETLAALEPPPASVRDVKTRLNWRTDRASAVLREWRSRVPHTGVGERGTVHEGTEESTFQGMDSSVPSVVPSGCPTCLALTEQGITSGCYEHAA